MYVKEFNFGRASSFLPATVLTISLATSICQEFCLAFKNVFFQEQLPLTASLSSLKSAGYSLPEVIYWEVVLMIFGIFPGKHPCLSIIYINSPTPNSIYLNHVELFRLSWKCFQAIFSTENHQRTAVYSRLTNKTQFYHNL